MSEPKKKVREFNVRRNHEDKTKKRLWEFEERLNINVYSICRVENGFDTERAQFFRLAPK